jgi:hypothetical protein
MQTMIAQVHHDTALLRERVGRLTGAAGRERLGAALEAVRAQVEAELEEAGSDASWDSESVGSRWVVVWWFRGTLGGQDRGPPAADGCMQPTSRRVMQWVFDAMQAGGAAAPCVV